MGNVWSIYMPVEIPQQKYKYYSCIILYKLTSHILEHREKAAYETELRITQLIINFVMSFIDGLFMSFFFYKFELASAVAAPHNQV